MKREREIGFRFVICDSSARLRELSQARGAKHQTLRSGDSVSRFMNHVLLIADS